MKFSATRFTREFVLGWAWRDAKGCFNPSFCIASSQRDGKPPKSWTMFLCSARRCDDGGRVFFANHFHA